MKLNLNSEQFVASRAACFSIAAICGMDWRGFPQVSQDRGVKRRRDDSDESLPATENSGSIDETVDTCHKRFKSLDLNARSQLHAAAGNALFGGNVSTPLTPHFAEASAAIPVATQGAFSAALGACAGSSGEVYTARKEDQYGNDIDAGTLPSSQSMAVIGRATALTQGRRSLVDGFDELLNPSYSMEDATEMASDALPDVTAHISAPLSGSSSSTSGSSSSGEDDDDDAALAMQRHARLSLRLSLHPQAQQLIRAALPITTGRRVACSSQLQPSAQTAIIPYQPPFEQSDPGKEGVGLPQLAHAESSSGAGSLSNSNERWFGDMQVE